jgi:hypothetical protein
MTLHCPKCGNIVPEKAGFCAFCGTPVKITPEIEIRRSGLPIAGGVLGIITACACLFIGIISTIAFAALSYYYYYYYLQYGLWFIGAFAFIGFAFGLIGGIFALKRTCFELAITGASLLLLSGFINILALTAHPYIGFVFAILGIPIVILSTLSLIFIAMSKTEFA